MAWTPNFRPGRALVSIAAITFLISSSYAAPLTESSAELEYYPVADSTGCYYNFQHYDEGDRILTNEPCLNCTCHNKMLMCYLRVCPFTKAIGADCTVEKRPDQCCPVITCPEVPVQLLPSSTTQSSSEVGHLDRYGCSIEGLFYSDGARVPGNPFKPCELCYCIRNKTACVMQECTLKIAGCQPVYQEGVCCPVRYDCDHSEDNLLEGPTSTTPGLIFTTTLSPEKPTDCIYNGEIYGDGALINKETPCEHCYCMKGDIVCAVQECAPTPLDKVNCTALPVREGQCCPDTYECDNMIEEELTTALFDLTTSSSQTKSPEEKLATEATTAYTSPKFVDRFEGTETTAQPIEHIPSATEPIEFDKTTEKEKTIDQETQKPERPMETETKISEEATEHPIITTEPSTERSVTEYSKPSILEDVTTEKIPSAESHPSKSDTTENPTSEASIMSSSVAPQKEITISPEKETVTTEIIEQSKTTESEISTKLPEQTPEKTTYAEKTKLPHEEYTTQLPSKEKTTPGVTEQFPETESNEIQTTLQPSKFTEKSQDKYPDKTATTTEKEVLVTVVPTSESPKIPIDSHVVTTETPADKITISPKETESHTSQEPMEEKYETTPKAITEESIPAHDETHGPEEEHEPESTTKFEEDMPHIITQVYPNETQKPISGDQVTEATTPPKEIITTSTKTLPEDEEQKTISPATTKAELTTEKELLSPETTVATTLPKEIITTSAKTLSEDDEQKTASPVTTKAELTTEKELKYPETTAIPEDATQPENTVQEGTKFTTLPPQDIQTHETSNYPPRIKPDESSSTLASATDEITTLSSSEEKTAPPTDVETSSKSPVESEITTKSAAELETTKPSSESEISTSAEPESPTKSPVETETSTKSSAQSELSTKPSIESETSTQHSKETEATEEVTKYKELTTVQFTSENLPQTTTQKSVKEYTTLSPSITKSPKKDQESELDITPPTEKEITTLLPNEENEKETTQQPQEEENEIPDSTTEVQKAEKPSSFEEKEITTTAKEIVEVTTTRFKLPAETSTKVFEEVTTLKEAEGHLAETTTTEHSIPGEGSCLVDGETYSNNTSVPTINHCQVSCVCMSSILQCTSVPCAPPPTNMQNCMPVYQDPDSCCPTYSCTGPGVTIMESDSHKMETTTPNVESTPHTKEKEGLTESGVEEATQTEGSTKKSNELPVVTVSSTEKVAATEPSINKVDCGLEGCPLPSGVDKETTESEQEQTKAATEGPSDGGAVDKEKSPASTEIAPNCDHEGCPNPITEKGVGSTAPSADCGDSGCLPPGEITEGDKLTTQLPESITQQSYAETSPPATTKQPEVPLLVSSEQPITERSHTETSETTTIKLPEAPVGTQESKAPEELTVTPLSGTESTESQHIATQSSIAPENPQGPSYDCGEENCAVPTEQSPTECSGSDCKITTSQVIDTSEQVVTEKLDNTSSPALDSSRTTPVGTEAATESGKEHTEPTEKQLEQTTILPVAHDKEEEPHVVTEEAINKEQQVPDCSSDACKASECGPSGCASPEPQTEAPSKEENIPSNEISSTECDGKDCEPSSASCEGSGCLQPTEHPASSDCGEQGCEIVPDCAQSSEGCKVPSAEDCGEQGCTASGNDSGCIPGSPDCQVHSTECEGENCKPSGGCAPDSVDCQVQPADCGEDGCKLPPQVCPPGSDCHIPATDCGEGGCSYPPKECAPGTDGCNIPSSEDCGEKGCDQASQQPQSCTPGSEGCHMQQPIDCQGNDCEPRPEIPGEGCQPGSDCQAVECQGEGCKEQISKPNCTSEEGCVHVIPETQPSETTIPTDKQQGYTDQPDTTRKEESTSFVTQPSVYSSSTSDISPEKSVTTTETGEQQTELPGITSEESKPTEPAEQQTELPRVTSEEPKVTETAAQQTELPRVTSEEPKVTETAAQQTDLPRVTSEEPKPTETAAQQTELPSKASEEPKPTETAAQQTELPATASEEPEISTVKRLEITTQQVELSTQGRQPSIETTEKEESTGQPSEATESTPETPSHDLKTTALPEPSKESQTETAGTEVTIRPVEQKPTEALELTTHSSPKPSESDGQPKKPEEAQSTTLIPEQHTESKVPTTIEHEIAETTHYFDAKQTTEASKPDEKGATENEISTQKPEESEPSNIAGTTPLAETETQTESKDSHELSTEHIEHEPSTKSSIAEVTTEQAKITETIKPEEMPEIVTQESATFKPRPIPESDDHKQMTEIESPTTLRSLITSTLKLSEEEVTTKLISESERSTQVPKVTPVDVGKSTDHPEVEKTTEPHGVEHATEISTHHPVEPEEQSSSKFTTENIAESPKVTTTQTLTKEEATTTIKEATTMIKEATTAKERLPEITTSPEVFEQTTTVSEEDKNEAEKEVTSPEAVTKLHDKETTAKPEYEDITTTRVKTTLRPEFEYTTAHSSESSITTKKATQSESQETEHPVVSTLKPEHDEQFEEASTKAPEFEQEETEGPAIIEPTIKPEHDDVLEKEQTTIKQELSEDKHESSSKPSTEEQTTSVKPDELPIYTSPELNVTETPSQEHLNITEKTLEPFTSHPETETTPSTGIAGELSTSPTAQPIVTEGKIVTTQPTTTTTSYEHPPEVPEYPGPIDDDYDEDQGTFGPGTCRYGGKVYVSAQQIPRDDPCDFCFCFRSDIICLQQSCPPPIPRCHEEPIKGFCCPRYECPVNMATTFNVTTTTTTTTTTLPPHFLPHAYKGRATKTGCLIQGRAYSVGEVIHSTSGPCLHCTCGGNGQMKCDPKACSPEPMLRQMIAAATRRRR